MPNRAITEVLESTIIESFGTFAEGRGGSLSLRMGNALKCPDCGGGMSRTHRRRLEKAVYSDAYVCSRCKTRVGWYYPSLLFFLVQFRFMFSWYSRCVRCGRQESVSRLEKRDHIDSVSKNPLALFQRLLWAPVHRCSPCRLQFYDWRPPRPSSSTEKPAPTTVHANAMAG